VVTANDYYPFGSQMPGRKYLQPNSSYRYGFNGQENSDEIGAGLTTAMYWEYDSRIGRRWNVDPVLKVWESPYLCFGGNPILYSDLLGDDANGDGGKGKKKKATPTTPAPPKTKSKSPIQNIQDDYEAQKKSYPAQSAANAKRNAEENKKPLVNITGAVTLGATFSLRAKVKGVGVSAEISALEIDLVGVRDNQGVFLGKNVATGDDRLRAGGVGLNILGFGYGWEATINEKKGTSETTEKVEIPFLTVEQSTPYNFITKKEGKPVSVNKSPLISIKAAAIIGVELNVDINQRNIIITPFPTNPLRATSDETRLPLPPQATLKKN
jgi:RHS repeat-associated protein